MNKEFIPYEQALALKELGFDEPCFGLYGKSEGHLYMTHSDKFDVVDGIHFIKAPTFSQAFRFFRKKYGLVMVIKPIDDKCLELGYNITKNGLIIKACTTYEEVELECLRKLIEIVKKD